MEDLCGDRAPCHPRLTLLPHTLPRLLRMESTRGNSIRAHFLAVAGVSEAEIRRTHQVFGPLDELKPSILVKGPFKVSLRKMPCEHLTFSTSDNQSTVGILELEAVLEAYITPTLRVVHVPLIRCIPFNGRAAGMPSMFMELMYSYVLFFARDAQSEKIGSSLRIDMDLVRDFRDRYSPVTSDLHL